MVGVDVWCGRWTEESGHMGGSSGGAGLNRREKSRGSGRGGGWECAECIVEGGV